MQRTVLGDRYTLLEVLGDGGMARVYLARDNVLDRDVALKVLREQYADDEAFVERFRREARSAASLNHPSIVQVYDQGRAQEDGTYYIAMEYVPGGTLKERIQREGALEYREAAGIASRVAEALQRAHGRGITHRDIKPQNVLLTGRGEAKVADFGIARAASSKTITETNLVLGTSAYMSPEQVRGERVGSASDLYSLGVVLYEALSGEQPYRADDPIATAMKHLEEPVPHPRVVNPEIPEGLDALVVKLLAKNPEERYASAAVLAEDLRRVRDGLAPLEAGPGEGATTPLREEADRTALTVVAPARAPGVPRRRRRLLPLIAALLVGIALLGGIAWALTRDASDQAGAGGRVEVPGVVGLTREEAQRRLEGAGLEIGSQDEAPSDEVAEGAVVEQDPRAGTEVREGIAVNLVLSTGPAQDPTTQASPSATSSATSTASSSATSTPSSASPAASEGEGDGEEAVERQRELEEAAREREKELQEEQRKAEEEQREAEKEANKEGGGKKGK